MKKFIYALLIVFGLTGTMIYLSADAQSPFPPWVSSLDAKVLPDGQSGQLGTYVQKTVRYIYNVPTHLGTVAAHGLGVFLPANAVITRSYFKIITVFTSGASGGGTVALHCEDANNIKTATDISGQSANAFVEGAETGAASAFVRAIAAPCEITATVAGTAQTAGKLVGWLNYVVEE